jgi:DNA invertase Pin-like site-specific DNA recombinase
MLKDRTEAVREAIYMRVGNESQLERKTTALYCRVASTSPIDNGAISIQTHILQRYADEMGFAPCTVYSDNGKSGVTLDRPAFKKMMSGIDNSDINCVVVKDIARVSRNPIQFEEWLGKMREKNVRVISINDGFDSFRDTETVFAEFRKLLGRVAAQN